MGTGVVIFFAFGPGCIAWFIIAEIFPLYARDPAMGLGVAINWVANWLVAFTFPMVQLKFGDYTFLWFAASTGSFYIFTYFFVPETKQRTIAEVTTEFEKMNFTPWAGCFGRLPMIW